ncbi:MAG: hypothetical protein EOO07_26825 [Chitinophagaceae bacterium]|nr:MAG: hypothetical protein EOO07_26825 [Chitinophagaceae bacterium]
MKISTLLPHPITILKIPTYTDVFSKSIWIVLQRNISFMKMIVFYSLLLLMPVAATFAQTNQGNSTAVATATNCYASGAAISSIEFSPSQKYLAINTENGFTKIYELSTLKILVTAHRSAYQTELKSYLKDGALPFAPRPKYYYEGMNLRNGNLKVNILDSLKRIVNTDVVKYKDPTATYFFGTIDIKTGSFVMNDEQAIAWFKPTGPKTVINYTGTAPDIDYHGEFSPSGNYVVLRDGNVILLAQKKVIKCDFDLRNTHTFNPKFSKDERSFTIIDNNVGLITYDVLTGKRINVILFPEGVSHHHKMETTVLPGHDGFIYWEDDDYKTINKAKAYLVKNDVFTPICEPNWETEFEAYTIWVNPATRIRTVGEKMAAASQAYNLTITAFNKLVKKTNATITKYNAAGDAKFIYKDKMMEASNDLKAAKEILSTLLKNHGDYLTAKQKDQVAAELKKLPGTVYDDYHSSDY